MQYIRDISQFYLDTKDKHHRKYWYCRYVKQQSVFSRVDSHWLIQFIIAKQQPEWHIDFINGTVYEPIDFSIELIPIRKISEYVYFESDVILNPQKFIGSGIFNKLFVSL